MTDAARKPVLWTAGEAAIATRGIADGDWSATGVSIDSRDIAPGDLFIAISGPNHDGHAFVADALAKGAVAAVVAGTKTDSLAGVSDLARLLRVDDTMSALQDLARAARDRTSAKIVAITGSVGKTGTKEALKLALSEQVDDANEVTATQGNLNNHWGLPLSLARMPKEARYGIFEMGMNHAGEISPLSRIARPHVVVITTVADVHSEFFDSLDHIADAKAEIFDGLVPDGTAILNRDNPMFGHLSAAARAVGVNQLVSFGTVNDADYRMVEIVAHGASSDITAQINQHTITYALGVPGHHLAVNSLAVLAAVQTLGADVEQAASSLANMRGLKGRGERHCIEMPTGMFELIDESYNASPASMAAAIAVLSGCQPEGHGRRIAVLGDMLELGGNAEEMHAALVAPLVEGGIDLVFTTGQYMSALWDALPADMRGGHTCVAEKLIPLATASVQVGDVVMVKGSLGSRTRQIVDALMHLSQHDDVPQPRVVNGG
jgi:UDP-N-acetylmuramoyl-tripeptide--D-alanyl-D-alanine ligase